MAQSIFKNMTPAQRVEARKQARLNKKKAASSPPAPRFSAADTNRGKAATAQERESMFSAQPKGYQPTAEAAARTAAVANKDFEDIFLSVVQFLSPDQQGRAFSLFGVFRQQPPEDQKLIVDSLMKVAEEQTGPLFNLYKQRIEQDTEYSKAALSRQMNNAKANYDRLVQTVDTNALRDKAKTDRNMAKVIRSITNTAFVDRVAGSGIQRRRTQEQIADARLAKEDIAVEANQTKGVAGQQLGQIEADIKAKLDREDVLAERDLSDNEQKQSEAERMLFLSLFENQFSNAGDNARDNIESGDIDPTTGKPGNNVSIAPGGVDAANIRTGETMRGDVFASGGTDDQRRTREQEVVRVKNAKTENDRIDQVSTSADAAVNRLFALNNYRAALRLANRDTSDVDREIDRLKPIAQIQLNKARANVGGFRGSSGSGLADNVDWFLKKEAEQYIFGEKLIRKYGSAPLDRQKLGVVLKSFSQDFPVTTFGVDDYTNLYNDFSSLQYDPSGKYINKYGGLEFDEMKSVPPTQSRVDVLAPAASPVVQRVGNTVLPTALAPVGSSLDLARQAQAGLITIDEQRAARDKLMFPSNVVSVPGSNTQVNLATRTYTGGKPLSRRR